LVEPDAKRPNMWGICMDERLSEMAILTRAKKAAITWALPRTSAAHHDARCSSDVQPSARATIH
jgi:hypothetical protein